MSRLLRVRALLIGGGVYAFLAGLLALLGVELSTMHHWGAGIILQVVTFFTNLATE